MKKLQRGLGRGLDALLGPLSNQENQSHMLLYPDQIVQGRMQPRKYFSDESLEELKNSIKKQGIIQPLIVRMIPGKPPKYEIIAGERRWRAAKAAGLTEIPVIVTEYTDREAMTVALVENLQRENLNPIEEAEAYRTLRDNYQLSQEELAEHLGKSRPAVTNALRLLQLPEEIRQSLASGEISAGHARALLGIQDSNLQLVLFHIILEQHLSVRETETTSDYCKNNGRIPEKYLEKSYSSQPRSPKSQNLKELEKSLRQKMMIKATISGSETKGKISLPYSSAEELQTLLSQLGAISVEKDSN